MTSTLVLDDDAVAAAHIRQAKLEAGDAGCPHADMHFSDRYDAYYCEPCDIWLEPLCEDPQCPICTRIPLRPSETVT